MKATYLLAALLGLGTAGSMAVDLNTDALKKMQQEGHKIVAEEKSNRAFELPNGQCLRAAGNNVASGKCNEKAKNQQWHFDDNGRLVAHNGKCVGTPGDGKTVDENAVLQKCNKSASQQWKLDKASRLANTHGICLQAKAQNVVTAKCNKAANQKWGGKAKT